ncbi:ribonuclease H-like domain-containing protein, partial [Apiosordaria backusii]
IIDTQTALADLVDTLSNLPTSPPSLYLDLEGENLGRKGTIAILQLHLLPTHHTYLIDVHTLQHATFTTTGHSGTTLKSVLESATIPKVFFDVRHDSDALYHLYGVSLAGIKDLQLMKHATYSDTRYVKGLATCIQWDAGLATSELHAAWAVKEAGKKLFCPELGGSYAVFSQRPLLDDIIRYCAQDAYILPLLYERYDWLINREHFATYFRETIARHEKMRVKDSQSEYFASWGKD